MILKKNKISLITIIFLIFLIIILISFSFILFTIQVTITKNIETNVIEKNYQIAETISNKVNDLLTEVENILNLFNKEILLNNNFIDLIVENFSFIDSIFIINEYGKVNLCSSNNNITGFDLSKRDFFIIPRENNETYISESFINENNYKPTIAISVPIKNNFIAVAYINFNNISKFINNRKNFNEIISVIDKNGYYILNSDSNFVYQRDNISKYNNLKESIKSNKKLYHYKNNNNNNEEEIIAISTIKKADLTVIVSQLKKELYKPVNLVWNSMFLSIIFTIIFALILCLIFLKIFQKEIFKLTQFIHSIVYSNNYNSFNDSYQSFKEFQILINDFNLMIKTIYDREKKIIESENQFKELFTQSPIAMLVIDHNYNIIYMNEKFRNIFGLDNNELKNLGDLWEKSFTDNNYKNEILNEWNNRYNKLIKEKKEFEPLFINLITKNNEKKIIEQRIVNLGNYNLILFSDFTEIKQNEEIIKKSYNEKILLLQEIHHRVKNNLQIIISLISLQESTIDSDFIKKQFNELKNRVKAMSLIHEKLYKNKDFSKINFGDYLKSITQEISKNFVYNNKIIPKIIYNLEDISISLEKSIPCGLFVNEILTNCYKYAFPDEKINNPEIYIELSKTDNKIKIIIGDNGIGIKDDFNIEETKSLGMKLIVNLIKQVDGTFTLERNSGTKWIIEIDN